MVLPITKSKKKKKREWGRQKLFICRIITNGWCTLLFQFSVTLNFHFDTAKILVRSLYESNRYWRHIKQTRPHIPKRDIIIMYFQNYRAYHLFLDLSDNLHHCNIHCRLIHNCCDSYCIIYIQVQVKKEKTHLCEYE